MRKSAKVLLTIAGIICVIQAVVDIIACICLVLDLGGIKTMIMEVMAEFMYTNENLSYYISTMVMELIFNIIISIYGANYFIKASRVKIVFMYNITSALVMGIIQLLFMSWVVGVLSIVASYLMRKGTVSHGNPFAQESMGGAYGPQYQYTTVEVDGQDIKTNTQDEVNVENMTIAVQKLKALKDNGVINEEEYYEHLNKILEGK